MVGLRPLRPLRWRAAALITLLFLCGSSLLLSCGDSGSSRPDPPDDPPPIITPPPRIASEDWPLLPQTGLTVRGLGGSGLVAADGTFPSLLDPNAGRQPLIASVGDTLPILLGFFDPASTDGVRLGSESTVEALIAIDPFFWGIDDRLAEQLLAACRPGISGIAAAVRSRISAGQTRYLVEPSTPELFEAAAGLLRATAGVSGACRGAVIDSLQAGTHPGLESAALRSADPVLVNPLAVQYAVGVYVYGTSHILGRFASGRSLVEEMDASAAPARAALTQRDGRYRLELHTGRSATPPDPISPAHLAFRLNTAAAASSWLRGLGRPVTPVWVADPARFTIEGLPDADPIRRAWVDGSADRFVTSLLRLFLANGDWLIGSDDRSLIDAYARVGIAQAAATASLPSGPFLCDLFGAPTDWGAEIRIRGNEVMEIDPPGIVRAPEALTAVFDRGAIRLTWRDLSTNEDAFVILRNSEGAGEEELARVPEDGTSFEDPFLESDSSYEYRVYAANSFAASAPTPIARVVTGQVVDVTAPSPVLNLAARGFAFDTIELTWNAPGDDAGVGRAAGYEIRYSTDPIDADSWSLAMTSPYRWSPAHSGETESFLVEGLLPGASYFFALKSVDDQGNWSPISNILSARTSIDRPDAHWMPGFAPAPFGQGLNGNVQAMAIFRGDLVAAGNFTRAGGKEVGFVARWDGNRWHPLGSGTNSWIYALTVLDGDLIAGGTFTQAGGAPAHFIARWDGSNWTPLGGGMDNNVRALIEWKGELYAGGAFRRAGGVLVNGVARWTGSAWDSLTCGVNNQVLGFGTHEGDLLVGGDFGLAGDVPGTAEIARWDGERWSPLGDGMDLDYVWCFATYRGDLIVGGQFESASGVLSPNLARWDGTRWHAFGSGANGFVHGLAVYNGDLIAAGWFTQVDGLPLSYVGRWDGSRWTGLGSGLGGGVVNSILVDGENLYFGGWLTQAGRAPSEHLARWKD